MTVICAHRVNEVAQLATVDPRFGVEIDLHSEGDRLILVHDAFATGEYFDEWLDRYNHAFIVVNTKEEGLESKIAAELASRGIVSWAFLDQSFPFMVRTLAGGETRTMVRVSEYESINTALALPNRPEWVWLDSFTGQWPEPAEIGALHAHGFRIMVVSPELQGRSLVEEMSVITDLFEKAGVPLSGVCSKQPEAWEQPTAAWWA